jgi:hypothetical protein
MKLVPVSVVRLIKILKKLGFEEIRQKGSINTFVILMVESRLFLFIKERIFPGVC